MYDLPVFPIPGGWLIFDINSSTENHGAFS